MFQCSRNTVCITLYSTIYFSRKSHSKDTYIVVFLVTGSNYSVYYVRLV